MHKNTLPQHRTVDIPVTPELARQWLEKNVRNRRPSPSVVTRYRSDMAANRWHYANDAICFDVDGNLINGQHRLMALAGLEGTTITFSVIFGLPTESQKFMDKGSRRSAAGDAEIAGVPNAITVTSGVRAYLTWREGWLFRDAKANTVTDLQVNEWIADNRAVVDRLAEYITPIRKTDLTPSVSYACALAFTEIDADLSEQFFRHLHDGGLPLGHPIHTLSKRLGTDRRNGVKHSQRDLIAFTVQAWNGWRTNRELTKFQRPAGSRWTPEKFPIPC